MGTAYYGHSLLWAQPTMGTAYYGHSLLWAQPIMGTAYHGHSLLWAAFYGHTCAQPSMGVQASPGEKHEGRAASGACSWSTECLHAAGSYPSQAAQAEAEASRGREGSPLSPLKITIFLTFEGPRNS